MKHGPVLISVLGAMLALSAQTARSSEAGDSAAAHVPHTAAARTSADLISRAERALRSYVAACASGEAQALSRVTTPDLRIEYAMDEPGTYLRVDAGALSTTCAAIGGSDARLANLWIFPTREHHSLFVQYDAQTATDPSPHRQLALIEMRGSRIASMLNFATVPSSLLASTRKTSAAPGPCVKGGDVQAQPVSTLLDDRK